MVSLNKVRRLPRELRDAVHEMLDQGMTVSEVTARLKACGADVSRSGVGRYRREWQESMRDMLEFRQFAESSVRALAEAPEDRGARMNIELMQGGIYRALTALRETMGHDPEKALKLLSKASMSQMLLSKATRDDAERTIKAADFRDAREGDLLVKRGDRLVRVELVQPDPPTAEDAVALPAVPAAHKTES